MNEGSGTKGTLFLQRYISLATTYLGLLFSSSMGSFHFRVALCALRAQPIREPDTSPVSIHNWGRHRPAQMDAKCIRRLTCFYTLQWISTKRSILPMDCKHMDIHKQHFPVKTPLNKPWCCHEFWDTAQWIYHKKYHINLSHKCGE